jgi:transposase
MDTSVSPLNSAGREWRRLRAWELFQHGWTQKAIAIAFGVTEGAVSQWVTRAKQHGADALKHRKPTGAKCKLTDAQKAQLPILLARGAEAFGFSGDAWTCERIAALIWREFEVMYHPDHVRKLLHACGWSYQTPICRATQRNEDAIQAWKTDRLPHLKKGQK